MKFVSDTFNIHADTPIKSAVLPTTFPESRLPANIRQELERISLVSVEGLDRYIRAHGQTLKDMVNTWQNTFKRIPDAVIWPENHEQVGKYCITAIKENNKLENVAAISMYLIFLFTIFFYNN